MVSAQTWVHAYIARVVDGHEELNDLDRRAGDGDFGDNLLGIAQRTGQAMTDGTPAFAALAGACRAAGGTSGPLFGMWFRGFARDAGDPLTVALLAAAARDGLDSVRRAAGAQVGDNTMVDAMEPAVRALEAADGGVDAALAAAARAAQAGAESTRDLLGRRGRSSYVGDHARGVLDPGAVAVAWFFTAATADEWVSP